MSPKKQNKAASSSKKIDFAKAFEELEEITKWFEDDEADLDEGLKKFERGLELSKICKDKLSEVENQVKELKVKFDLED